MSARSAQAPICGPALLGRIQCLVQSWGLCLLIAIIGYPSGGLKSYFASLDRTFSSVTRYSPRLL
jgi:hypothetical protein